MDLLIYAILSVKNDSEKLNVLLAEMKGVAGADLAAVAFESTSVVVSNIQRADLAADRNTAIEYAAVIETLSQHFALLPVRFGSVMESKEAIISMLEKNHPDIQKNLINVENKYEFGIRIFCQPEILRAELRAKSEAMYKNLLPPATETKNSATWDWVNKKLREHRLEELLIAHVDSVITDITEQLDRLNAISKIKKMVTPTTIIDGVFLIDKVLKDELIHIAGDLQNKYHGLNFILTGPWPPYSFVDFTVK